MAKHQMKRSVLFYCVDEKTEALTTRGWVSRKQLVIGEDILTYTMGSGALEWKPVKSLFQSEYRGHLLTFGTTSFNKVCTIDHRFVTNQGFKDAWKIRAKDRIPLNGRYVYGAGYPIADSLLMALARIVTDDSAAKADAPVNFHENPDDLWSVVFHLEEQQLALVYDTMLKARESNTKQIFQLVCLLTGHYSSKRSASCIKPSPIWYQGIVWCPHTENGTWIMRREGLIIPTGNSWPS